MSSLAAQAPTKHAHAPGKHPQPATKPAPAPMKPGVERWSVKTSLPDGADPTHAKAVVFADLIALADPPGVKHNDPRFQSLRIPAFANSLNVKEGDLLTVNAWLFLVAAENDGDYHIQVSASPQSGDHCLIVEVPKDDPAYVSSAALRPLFQSVRAFLKIRTLQDQEPSPSGSVMAHPPYVQVTGQLFYDDSHFGDAPRGKKNMHAATLWELHPVAAMKFAPNPK